MEIIHVIISSPYNGLIGRGWIHNIANVRDYFGYLWLPNSNLTDDVVTDLNLKVIVQQL